MNIFFFTVKIMVFVYTKETQRDTNIIFRSQFTLSPASDPSIAATHNSRQYQTFLVRNLYTFYFRQCSTVSFKLSWIFVTLFFSQFNGQFRYTKIKIPRDLKSLFTSIVDVFLNCKNFQSAMEQE